MKTKLLLLFFVFLSVGAFAQGRKQICQYEDNVRHVKSFSQCRAWVAMMAGYKLREKKEIEISYVYTDYQVDKSARGDADADGGYVKNPVHHTLTLKDE